MTAGSGAGLIGPPSAGGPGMPLAVRLGLVLSATTLVVLLVAGAVVNRVVSQSFEDVVSAQQQEQVQAAADAIAEFIREGRPGFRGPATIVDRLARSLGAEVVVRLGGSSVETLRTGPKPPVGVETRQVIGEASAGDIGAVVVEAYVPVRTPERPFLRLFNIVLVVGGLAAVAVIAGLSVLIARRQTRPLRDVAAAASRLEGGDLTARATGGGDRESQELAGAFNAMAARVERSEMLRRRAASDMAHDLATPATVLEGQLQAMIDGVVPKSRANLEVAAASAAALGGVIVQLGELASAEAAPLQARPERVAVAAALAEAASSLDGLYRERGVTLRVEPVAPELAAWADPTHLGRALRNVLTNAAQHSPSGAAVRLTATSSTTGSSPGRVRVRVTDEGRGIPAGDLPHIFERFYRSDPARTASPGASPASAGIGLTIARELLAPSGAAISVERTGPEGTTFLIDLRSA